MIKRLHLGYFIVSLVVLATGVYFARTALAADSSPDSSGAFYTLRYHSSGIVRRTTLAIYSPDSTKPVNGQFDINKSGYGCKPSKLQGKDDTKTKDIRVAVTLGSSTPYNKELGDGSCKNDESGGGGVFTRYTVPDNQWQWNPAEGRWHVDLTVAISGGDNNNPGWYDGRNNDERRAWFQFRVVARADLLMTNRANSLGSTDYQTNYGVTNGSEYTIDFAQPCTEEDSKNVQAGMWDPDDFYTRIRIEQKSRSDTSADWKVLPIGDRSNIPNEEGSGGNKWYEPTKGSDINAYFNFQMNPTMKYRLHLKTNTDNVVSLFWPNDSIQADLDCGYDLNPTTTLNPNQSLNPGATMQITSTVTNTNPLRQPNANWYVTKLVYNDGNRSKSGTDSSSDPSCAYFGAAQCEVVQGPAQGASNYPFTQASESRGFTYKATNNDVGKRICFVTSISPPVDKPRRNAGNVWRHSNIECVLVSKTPKVQVLGSDLRVLGSIGASTSVRIGDELKSYGSWIEYGAFSTGPNSLAGSGSSFRDGTTSDENSWSQLTFSNITSPKGNYGVGSLPVATTASDFDNLESTGNLASGDISAANGVYRVGDINLNGNILSSGKSIVILSSGTVTINNDIIIGDNIEYKSPDDISQVVIVANNIVINRDVSRVDAWLLTRNSGGLVNTCNEVGTEGNLDKDSCPKPLQVNGAVITDKLYLRRTGGADADTHSVAAEVFNLRASSYMWAYNFVNKQDRAQTTYIKELPPRF